MENENQALVKSVGAQLREARLAKGLTLEEVEIATHIYSKHLLNLENDEYDKTPGEFFVKGAIRNYGNFLGLNGPELVDQYKASQAGKELHEVEAHGIREAKNVTMKLQLKDKRDIGSGDGKFDFKETFNADLPWKQIAMGVVGLAFIGLMYYVVPSVINWSSNTVSNITDAKPTPTPEVINQNKKEEKPKAKPDKLVLELQSSDRCWLEVVADGKKIEETMLNAGDKKSYEAKDKLVVKYGNVGAVKIILNGEVQDINGEHGVANKVYSREDNQEAAKPEEAQKAVEKESPKTEPEKTTNAEVKSEAANNAAAAVKEEKQAEAPAEIKETAKADNPAVQEKATEEAAKAETVAKEETKEKAKDKK